MILKVAWRNIWRSPLRSFIVLASMVLGIWAGVFVVGFSFGLNNQRVAEAIYSTVSHVQIHNPAFVQDESAANYITDINSVQNALKNQPQVAHYSARTVFNGMVQSATAARGINILGVNPMAEDGVSTIPEKLVEGDWFSANKKNRLVVGQRLAKVLKVKMGSKVVLTFQDAQNNLISARFTIGGIYKSANSKLDELQVYTKQSDLFALLGDSLYYEVAILAESTEAADALTTALQLQLPNLSVQSWRQLAPELAYADQILATSLMLIMGIIMLALMFGIINNMLMAILERRHELGMLQAVGMNKQRIFSMILIETVLIGMVGGPLGIVLGLATIAYFGRVGIDLSIFGQGLESFGIATRIHPEINLNFVLIIAVMVLIMSVLASLYPAIKALKLNPVAAIRGV